MIATFMGQFFNISLVRKPCRIWRYDFVEGFKFHLHNGTLPVYENFLDISDVGEIFDVGFTVKWDGVYFDCLPNIEKGTAYLRSSDKDEAENHGFLEEIRDRGMVILWYKVVCLDECEEFRFHKTVYAPEYFTENKINAKTDSYVSLSREEWADIHRKTVYELSPWNYRK